MPEAGCKSSGSHTCSTRLSGTPLCPGSLAHMQSLGWETALHMHVLPVLVWPIMIEFFHVARYVQLQFPVGQQSIFLRHCYKVTKPASVS